MSLPVWTQTNGWREIFTRILEGWSVDLNSYPEWLVNPESKRRLKLDFLCFDLGLAVRFEGVKKRGQRSHRLSLQEEEQQKFREAARAEICRQHGVELVVVDVTDDETSSIFRTLDLILSQAKRQAPDAETAEKVSQTWTIASTLGRRIKMASDLKLYADLWSDREFKNLPTASDDVPPPPTVTYKAGMDVEHVAFGLGTITKAEESGGDLVLTVEFLDVGKKTLAASFVGDKLSPLS